LSWETHGLRQAPPDFNVLARSRRTPNGSNTWARLSTARAFCIFRKIFGCGPSSAIFTSSITPIDLLLFSDNCFDILDQLNKRSLVIQASIGCGAVCV
jgi:hypothetical protein